MNRHGMAAAAALMAFGLAAHAEPDVVEIRPEPRQRRRGAAPVYAASEQRAARFIGDGFDAARMERAEFKRARKANRPSIHSTRAAE